MIYGPSVQFGVCVALLYRAAYPIVSTDGFQS